MDVVSIVEPDNAFNFKSISLGTLNSISSGSFFSRIFSNSKTLFIQTPKSLTKQGFTKSGKKIYCDLMFTNQDEIFVNWIENLESTCQQLIYDKRGSWFTTEETMDMNDIENAFTSPIKLYKSGKYYLIRVNIKNNIKIFDESGKQLETEDVKSEMHIISVIEIRGIRFASKNFQIELEMKQCMVVSPDPFLESCFIKAPLAKAVNNNRPLQVKPAFVAPPPLPVTPQVDNKYISSIVDDFLEKGLHKEEPNINNVANIVLNKETGFDRNAEEVGDDYGEEVGSEDENYDFIEDVDTKMNTEINSKTTSNIQVAKSDEQDHGTIHISDNVADISLGIVEIVEIVGEKDLKEISLKDMDQKVDDSLETISLKKPNQVYYDIYKTARKKAKEIKKNAILAYLEAKNIKKTYMLEDIEDSDSDSSVNMDSDFDSLSIDGSDSE